MKLVQRFKAACMLLEMSANADTTYRALVVEPLPWDAGDTKYCMASGRAHAWPLQQERVDDINSQAHSSPLQVETWQVVSQPCACPGLWP
jgi:hypothetical protein